MKVRTTLAALAVAAATLVTAGPAAAAQEHFPQTPGPTLDVTMSGPSGVVWTGQCQAFIYEDKMEQLPPNCRAHGSNEIRWLEGMGVTSIVKSYQGQMATSMTIAPDGKSATFVDNPGPWMFRGPLLYGFYWPEMTEQTVQTCQIVNHVLSEGLPCETNQAFKDYAAKVNAAVPQYLALLKAHHKPQRTKAHAKARSTRR
jgi:hypothetical protein